MRRAGVPPSAKTFAQLHPHARVLCDIADVSRLHSVLSHDPEPIADSCVAHRSPPRLSSSATRRFKESISGRHDADSKEELHACRYGRFCGSPSSNNIITVAIVPVVMASSDLIGLGALDSN